MQREIAYTGREGPPLHRPGSATYPHAAPNSPPPAPVSHSMPASPSRIPYGGARPLSGQGNPAIPKERLSSMPASRSISPSPSAILERRDVKPDEDLCNKNVQLIRNEGMYADPYMFHEGRMSVASSHTGHPLDVPDHVFAYHRGALRSSSTYSNSSVQSEMMEQSIYRQKSRKYTDGHLPNLGSRTPPSSPHRVTDIRMTDLHVHNAHGTPHSGQSDRSSPIRHSFKKESGPPVYMEATMTKVRNASGLQAMVDVVPSPTDKQTLAGYGPAAPPKETYTRERMQAMEKQIASLTGLVQSALMTKGQTPTTAVDTTSEKITKTASNTTSSAEIGGTSYVTGGKNSSTLVESATIISHLPPAGSVAGHVSLQDMRRNVSELRLQLHKMRQLQLQNQDVLRAMVKKAELEINSRVIETVKRLEDPVQRQRVLVEQERQKYLHEEETLMKKISDLEGFVDELKKDSTSVNKGLTLKDVEDGAFSLRQIGEAVANLKGAFPPLQNKMRAVLRVEVEAVRFLKEEPHKLDSLLKRIRNMTDVLTTLRRYVTEGVFKGTESSQKVQYPVKEKTLEADPLRSHDEVTLAHSFSQQIIQESKAASVKSEPFSSLTIHHVQSSPVTIHQSLHSTALVNYPSNSPAVPCNSVGFMTAADQVSSSPVTTQESVVIIQQTQTSQSPPPVSVNGSSTQGFFINEIHHANFRNRAVSIEEAEKKWEEKRQNLDHYNGKEFEKLLEEAQANIMKSIPSLEMPAQSPKIESMESLEVFEDAPEAEQENDNVMKSPPPPPPRRIYPPGSGLATTRASEVVHVIKKESTKELNEDVSPTFQLKVSRSQTEGQASHPTPPLVTDSVPKDDDEQEGERIMAELQSFQKCSFMDTQSKGHVEQSRNDTQTKDIRTVGFSQLKEKKNLEYVQEEVLKSDDGYENTSPTEYSRVIYCGAAVIERTPDIVENIHETYQEERDKNRISETSEIAEKEIPPLVYGNAILKMGVVTETDQESKNVITICDTPSGDSSLIEISKSREQGATFPVHDPVVEHETVRINYRVSSVVGESISHNELGIVDGQANISSLPSACKNDEEEDSKIQDLLQASKLLRERELPFLDYSQQVVLRPKTSRNRNAQNIEDPTSPCNSPTDNIAFMITQNEVQVLSSGEVRDIVSREGDDVQTVNIDARADRKKQYGVTENVGNEDPVLCMDKKPVIIIFDEPMDIRSAYKRLSTVFEECEEELEKMMTEGKIIEEDEDEDSGITSTYQQTSQTLKDGSLKISTLNYQSGSNPVKSHISEEEGTSKKHFTDNDDINSGMKCDFQDGQLTNREDVKKKFKFKFPKKQLAALTQAIRTGTKTGKKTLQVVVYEEEEEPDGTVKQHKEAKRFEIARSKSKEEATKNTLVKQQQNSETAGLPARTDEIRKNTFRTLDSLEQTIKQLENTISEMSPKVACENLGTVEEDSALPPSSSSVQLDDTPAQEEIKAIVDSPTSIPSAPRKVLSGSSLTSRMPIPMASKSRQQGSTDKTGKQPKLQEPQRQYRQANGGTKKAGGDLKATSPTLTSSRIPAFSPTSGKSSCLPAYCGESPNALSPSTKSPVPSSNSLSPQVGRTINSSSLIPSIPNGSSKNPNPTYTGKGHHLSFSPQTSNGRPSLSSPSPTTPTSPPSLGQGMKNVRTIHTPTFTSYKTQNGNARKTSTANKETS